VLGFFIGIFGAMAILGVFFKILKLPNYELYMAIGFIGEAAAFISMGVMGLVGAFSKEDKAEQVVAELVATPAVPAAPPPDLEVRASFQKMLEKQVSDDVNKMMLALSEEVERFGQEIQQVGGELERTRGSVYNMRLELDRVASGDLAGDAEQLGRGMKALGTEMGEAGSTVERMRTDLDEMARRFRYFNEPTTTLELTEPKIKKMPWS
jgi:hypothetical protein